MLRRLFYSFKTFIFIKSSALENYGVQEMSYQEQNETDGGILPLIGVAVGLFLAWYAQDIVNNPVQHYDASVKGYTDGYKAATK